MKKWTLVVKAAILGIVIFLLVFTLTSYIITLNNSTRTEKENQKSSNIEKPPSIGSSTEIKQTSDGTKYLVNPNKIIGGGPPKDGIPSIDNPKFITVSEADEWLDDDDDVFGFITEKTLRAYPQPILVWHEIVNDIIDEVPVAITYCPLCGSSIAFDRRLDHDDNNVLEFGTSGKLYNSNLVMYDRQTDTYWTQIQGKAIIGELTGKELEILPLQTIKWKAWKEKYPDSEVLSKDTGNVRSYGTDPYENYYTSDDLFFPVENSNSDLPAKSFVLGIEIKGAFKAYPEALLKQEKIIEDTFNGNKIRLEIDEDDFITITNIDTSEKLAWERDFFFAWFAFHPHTDIYAY